ncbi:hypothetical protein Bca4012_082748 [Brassica carinata]
MLIPKASRVGRKTIGVVPSATTTSLVHSLSTVNQSKKQHEKLNGSSNSRNSSAEAEAAIRKRQKCNEESDLPIRTYCSCSASGAADTSRD